jgi:hypothetical protein
VVAAVLIASSGDSDEPNGEIATPGTSRIGTITVNP